MAEAEAHQGVIRMHKVTRSIIWLGTFLLWVVWTTALFSVEVGNNYTSATINYASIITMVIVSFIWFMCHVAEGDFE